MVVDLVIFRAEMLTCARSNLSNSNLGCHIFGITPRYTQICRGFFKDPVVWLAHHAIAFLGQEDLDQLREDISKRLG